MDGVIDTLQRGVGLAAISLLPGAMLAFSPTGGMLTAWPRLYLSLALTPLVVLVEFYLLRLVGVPVSLTPHAILLLGAPAAFAVVRVFRAEGAPQLRTVLLAVAALTPALVYLWLHQHDSQVRAFIAHTFLHTDLVQGLQRGELHPEEALLAGIPTSYPWGGDVYVAVVGQLLGVPAPRVYPLINLLSLLSAFGLVAELTRALGGKRLAVILAPLALAFSTNAVGLTLKLALTAIAGPILQEVRWLPRVLGDSRYEPWVRKYVTFNENHYAFALLAGILLICVQPWPRVRGPLILLGSLLVCTGLVYPLLLPAAFAIVGARFLAIWLVGGSGPIEHRRRVAIELVLAVLAGGIVSAVALRFVTESRVTGSGITIDSTRWIVTKAAAASIALCPALVGFALLAREKWRTHRFALVVVTIATLSALALNVLITIPHWRNEYKYVMAAALCLAPFPFIALERLLRRVPAIGTAVTVAVAACFLFAPFVRAARDYPFGSGPSIRFEGLELRLGEGERLRGAVDAIRRHTPANTVVVARPVDLHLPVFASRPLYAPYAGEKAYAGLNLDPDYVLEDVKGYGPLVKQRQATLAALFEATQNGDRKAALATIRRVRATVAVLIQYPADTAVQAWLAAEADAACVYRDTDYAVWLVPAPR